MLDARRDRLDYGELLRPPPGFHFDRAVATTYTTNLETLLSIPVALVYDQTLEGDFSGGSVQLLEAIKRFSGKVKVFHQKGGIHLPAKGNWLFAYLEEALAPVLMEDPNACFHPKTWVVRYAPIAGEEGEQDRIDRPPIFRAIVLSRNLDFSRSWDLAAKLEGEAGPKARPENRPLVDFLRWLNQQHGIQWIDPFLEELARVDFQTPQPFGEHRFRPMGISGYQTDPTRAARPNRALVMSPFVDTTTIDHLRRQTSGETFLFGEPHEMEKLSQTLLDDLPCYQLSELIVDGESVEVANDDASEPQTQSLHAKLYVFQEQAGLRWFIGSANATQAARNRNVEFLLELWGESDSKDFKALLKELKGEKDGDGPFVPFPPKSGEREDSGELRREEERRLFEHELLFAKITAAVEPAEDGNNFDLRVSLDLGKVKLREGFEATLEPFNTTGHSPATLRPGETNEHVFRNIAEVELSRFLCFRVHDRKLDTSHAFLVKVEVEQLPTDRLENILRKIIDSREKFFEYLRFLLADEVTKEELLRSIANWERAGGDTTALEVWQEHLPIYEKLLVAASRNPRRLAEVDELIRELAADSASDEQNSVVSAAFLSFWDAFRALIPPKRNRHT
jgi:hypothetical protein